MGMRTKARKLQNAILYIGDEIARVYERSSTNVSDRWQQNSRSNRMFCCIKYKHKDMYIYYVMAYLPGKYSPLPLPTYEAALVMYAGTIYAWMYFVDMVMWLYEVQVEERKKCK